MLSVLTTYRVYNLHVDFMFTTKKRELKTTSTFLWFFFHQKLFLTSFFIQIICVVDNFQAFNVKYYCFKSFWIRWNLNSLSTNTSDLFSVKMFQKILWNMLPFCKSTFQWNKTVWRFRNQWDTLCRRIQENTIWKKWYDEKWKYSIELRRFSCKLYTIHILLCSIMAIILISSWLNILLRKTKSIL